MAKKAKVGDTIKCPYCGNEFIKNTPERKFCSTACRKKYHHKEWLNKMRNFNRKMNLKYYCLD